MTTRVLGRIAWAIATLVGFVIALLVGAVLHITTPAARRAAAELGTRALTDLFQGALIIEDVDSLDLGGTVVGHVEVVDPTGRSVIELWDVTVRMDVLPFLDDLFRGTGPLTVLVPHVRAERARVLVAPDRASGQVSIASALTPRDTGAGSGGEGREVKVGLPMIEIGETVGRVAVEDLPNFKGRVVGIHGRVLATSEGAAVDVRRFGANLQLADGTEARGTGTLSVRAPGPIRGSFEGFYGDVEVQARVAIDGKDIEAHVTLPGAKPEAVRQLIPEWPIHERVSGTIEAAGTFPELDVSAHLKMRKATVKANGTVTLDDPPRADLSFSGKHLDLRSVVIDAPKTDLTLEGKVELGRRDGKFTVAVGARSDPTELEGESVPAAEVEGVVVDGAFSGHAKLHEPGLPLVANVEVSSEGAVDLDIRAPSVDLARVKRIELGMHGRGSARLRAHIESDRVAGTYALDLEGFKKDAFTARSLKSEGSFRGELEALDNLYVDGAASAHGIEAGPESFDQGQIAFKGRWPNATFEASVATGETSRGQAAGRVNLMAPISLSDLRVAIEDGPVRAEGTVTRVVPDEGIVEIEHFEVTGVGGRISGQVRYRPGLLETQVVGSDISLERVAEALGLPKGTISGTLRIDADIVTGEDVTRGRMNVGLGRVSFGPVHGLSASGWGTLDGQRLEVQASGIVEDVGTFGASVDGKLAGSPLDAKSYLEATGHAEVTLSELNLPLLGLALRDTTPLDELDGRAYARFIVERDDPAGMPRLMATATTRGLIVRLDPDETSQEPPIEIQGIDVHATGALDGRSGDASGTLVLMDENGELMTTSGAVKLDTQSLVDAPEKAPQTALQAPIDLIVRLPRRPLAALPAFVAPEDLSGSIEATAQVKGRIASPTLVVLASVRDLGAPDADAIDRVDIDTEIQYDPGLGHVEAGARVATQGRTVARANAIANLTDGMWEGNASMQLDGVPVGALPGVPRDHVTGYLHGSVDVERTKRRHHGSAHLQWLQGAIGRSLVQRAELSLKTDHENADVELHVDNATGSLNARARVPIDWTSPIPRLHPARSAWGTVDADDFDIAALDPLVRDTLRRLGGRLDAHLEFELASRHPEDADDSEPHVHVAGTASVEDGQVLIQPLGMDLRDIRFDATAQQRGHRTFIAVDGIVARVRTQEPNVTGDASLEFDFLRLATASANLTVEDIPLLFQGVSQGRATGIVTAHVNRKPELMSVELDMPRMTVRLPRSSSRTAISLSDNPDIAIVQSEPIESDPDILPWQLVVKLGEDVHLRQSDIDIGVTGAPVVMLGQETEVNGSVELTPGGRVPVFGKVFVIESGTVYFDTGDPGNPRLDVTASWRAPGDTMVYVDLTGKLKEPRIALRSDPPLPEPEVFALLLGGTSSEPASDTNQAESGRAAGAVGIGSGVAALGVNELLGDSPVELRVGTTSESRPRYTAAVRIGQDLWFEASTYQRSTTGLGNDVSSVFSGTIDYRFTRNWSLRTEIGTAGGVVDLLWQYRY